MKPRDPFTKILALVGCTLLWFPLLAPFLLAAAAFISRGRLLFDALMRAELFPLVLLGGLLLLWGAVRARARRAWVAWSLGAAVAMLFGGQALAFFSGLASGAAEPEGLPWALVLTSLALYAAGVASAGLGGVFLVRDLFRASRQQPQPANGAAEEWHNQ